MDLDTSQIDRILTFFLPKGQYYGCLAKNELPKDKVSVPFYAVVNYNPSSVRLGGHWVSLYINKNNEGVFICSYGLSPHKELAVFMKKNAVLTMYNTRLIQNPLGKLCGYYACFSLIRLYRGDNLEDVMKNFSSDFVYNDSLVLRMVHSICADDQ